MIKFLLLIFTFIAKVSKRFKYELFKLFYKLKHMLKTETKESKKMLEIYFKYTKNHATKEEIQWANNQMGDLMKTFGVSTLLILPFAPLTLPFLIKLAEKLGVSILPDSFHEEHPELKKPNQ